MRGNSLVGSLVFAAVAALGLVPFVMAVYPVVGAGTAVTLYNLAVAALYVAWIAPSWARGLRMGLVAALLLVIASGLSWTQEATWLGAALVLAVLRSGFLYRSRAARALLLEVSLVGTGLLFARTLASSSLMSLALALWGFYLVQSLYFVMGGVSQRTSGEQQGDAFTLARDKLVAVMDDLR